MSELSQLQMKTIERLFEAGFRPIAIAPYEGALCVRRGQCVAMLEPVPNAGIRLKAPVSYIIDGKFSVRLKRGNGEVFVSKKTELQGTPERLKELDDFRSDLTEILEASITQ